MFTRVTEKAIKPPSVTSSQPLNFELYYGNSAAPTEMNTVYLDDGNAKVDLNLVVFNESSTTITFVQASSGNPSQSKFDQVSSPNSANEANEGRCHFSITFGKDLNINPAGIELQEAQKNDWQVNYDEDQQFTTIYFLRKEGIVLQAKNPDNTSDRILLTCKNFAARNGLVKTSNVKLTYGSSLLLDGKNQAFTRSITVNNAISVTNHPENKTIPLQVRCVGPNTILNDGTAPNTLKLQIINRSLSANRPNLLLHKANSKFIVRFETGEGAEYLTTLDKVTNGTITSTDATNWRVDRTPNQAEWTVKLKDSSTKTTLADKETIDLNISNLVTSNPSGVAYLYITYQNISTYPDGQLVVPIEKTPLLYRDIKIDDIWHKRVGIGINNPSAKLHVSGGDAIVSGKLAIRTTNPTIDLAIGDNDTGLKQEADGKLAIYTNNSERVRIDENGNVGIGTTSPSVKLHVSGGDAIVSGKVGIGVTSPSEKLEVSGNIKATGAIRPSAGNTENQGIMFPKDPGGGGGDAAWIRYYARSGEACTLAIGISDNADDHIALMPGNGNVGIGTDSPSAKLHVEGNLLVKGDVSIKGNNLASLHYGNRGILTPNFNPDGDNNGLWLEASTDGAESGGIFCNGNTIVLWSPGDNDILRVYDEDHFNSPKFVINSVGNVGIGTTNPQIHLAIGDNDTGLQQQGDGKLAIYTNNSERVRIVENGNVGIGTTDPKQKLHVEGRIRLNDVPVWDGGGGYDLTWVAHNYDGANENDSRWKCIAREGSSERYKQNIAPLEDDFQKLLSLQPKQYQMREGYGDPNTWEFGYLAEDLDKIGLKSLVIYNQSGQPDGIQYKKMCIYLNEVVKSQQSSMERLEEKVNELNEKVMSSL